MFLKNHQKTSCKAYCSGDNYKIDIAQNTLKNKAYGYGPVDEYLQHGGFENGKEETSKESIKEKTRKEETSKEEKITA